MSRAAACRPDPAQDENVILHRLGEAVALTWRFFPEPVREVILNQAETPAYRGERCEALDALKSVLDRYSARAR